MAIVRSDILQSYLDSLDQCLSTLEVLYCTGMDPTEYKNSPITVCVDRIMPVLKGTSPNVFRSLAVRSESTMAIVSYVYQRLNYHGACVLSFAKMPYLDNVAGALFILTEQRFKSELNDGIFEIIVKCLSEVDQEQTRFKVGTGYRYLKLVVFMSKHSNFIDVSIISRLLLHQIYLSNTL